MGKVTVSAVSWIFGLLFTLVGLPLQAADTTVKAASQPAEQLIKVLSQLKDLEAEFFQQVNSSKGKRLSSSKGIVRLAKPELFFWQVKSPSQQTIVLDKGSVIIVDNDLEQVSSQPLRQEGLGPNPVLLLSSNPSLALESYQVSRQKLAANVDKYTLKPKGADSNAMFETLSLLFADNVLQEMYLFDNLGQQTTISFTDIKLNKGIHKSKFKLNIPKHFDRLGEVG